MKMLCRKYKWTDETDMRKVNFFSDSTHKIAGQEIDLLDFMVDNTFSGIESNIENIDPSDYSLYIESANMSLQVWNRKEISSNFYISDFFGIYTFNTKLKFLVSFFDDNNQLIFKGIIYKDGVKFPVRETEHLVLNVVSFEKEFKEYFKTEKLKACDFIDNPDLRGFASAGLAGILNVNLNSSFTNINLHEGVNNWNVVKHPYMFYPWPGFRNAFIFCKTGYESFRRDECTIYDWLNSTCLPMGWQWFFYNGQFHIKERADLSYPVLELNYDNTFIEHSIDNKILDQRIDNVIIDDGEFYSNGRLLSPVSVGYLGGQKYLGGERKIIYSGKNYYSNDSLPFQSLQYYSGNQYELHYGNKFVRSVFRGTDHDFIEVSVYQPEPNISGRPFSYSSNNSLWLKPYINSQNHAAGLDITLARVSGGYIDIGNGNFFATNIPMGNNDFRYTGHAANSLYRYNSALGRQELYSDYIRTQTFRNNFKKFTLAEAQLQQIPLIIKTNQIITNPLQVVKILNYPYYNFAVKLMSIQGLKCDPFTRQSEIKVLV